MDEPVDPRAELERLIVDHTCEWCGETLLPQEREDGKYTQIVTRQWLGRKVSNEGYTSTHWRNWRVCVGCVSSLHHGGFARWIFPVIRNMAEHDLIDQLVAVQPMAQPAAQMLYMDIVVDAHGARVNRREPEPHPLLRRFAETEIDHTLYGRVRIDKAQKDKDDAAAILMHVVKNREPVRGRRKHVVMLDDANFRLAKK